MPAPDHPLPRATPVTRRCDLCKRARIARRVHFRRHFGAIVTEHTQSIAGELCSPCVEDAFWSTTLPTLILGWWSLRSLVQAPLVLAANLSHYVSARRSFAARDRTAPEPFGATSLALGVATLPMAGLLGMGSVAGAIAGLVGLARARSGQAVRRAALGVAVNGLTLLVLVSVVTAGTVAVRALRASREADLAAPGSAGDLARADDAIALLRGGVAFGNGARARELAARFVEQMELRHEVPPVPPGSVDFDLARGRFLAHVELRRNTACFLVHVPSPLADGADQQRQLLDDSWKQATVLVRSLPGPVERELAVALRGNLLYWGIALGRGGSEGPTTSEVDIALPTERLHRFFDGAPLEGGNAELQQPLGDSPDP